MPRTVHPAPPAPAHTGAHARLRPEAYCRYCIIVTFTFHHPHHRTEEQFDSYGTLVNLEWCEKGETLFAFNFKDQYMSEGRQLWSVTASDQPPNVPSTNPLESWNKVARKTQAAADRMNTGSFLGTGLPKIVMGSSLDYSEDWNQQLCTVSPWIYTVELVAHIN